MPDNIEETIYRGQSLLHLNDLDFGVEYLCFNQLYPMHDYRMMRINRDTKTGDLINFFSKINRTPAELFSDFYKDMYKSDKMIAVINLRNKKLQIMTTDIFKQSYSLLPTQYKKFYPYDHIDKKVKVFDPASLEVMDIVVLTRNSQLFTVLNNTIETHHSHFARTAKALSCEDMYRQFAKGKVMGVSSDMNGVINHHREELMSRFFIIEGEEE